MTVTTGCQRPSLVEMIREIRRPAALPPWVRPTATFSSTNLLNTNPSTTLAAWVDKAAQMSLGRKSLTLMPRGSARAQPPLPAATMPGTICNACQVVLIFDAELSPRTFCTFRRDLSSVPRTVSHWRTARDVLEGLSGVNERRMIIPMTTTGRLQQRYDHRLRDLVQGTGDLTIATDLGVPRSTARGWLGMAPKVVVGLDVTDLRVSELSKKSCNAGDA